MNKIFTSKIIDWHVKENKRIMPWKGEKDPYKIWISGIILQQTRVLQGLAYYNNFIKEFPTLESLALAQDEAVFKKWEGLGYYNRCKNLIYTARDIYKNLGGKFPETYNSIIALKGIGPYTAAAISSFAYGLPHAVVDGNVFRILARVFGQAIPIDSSKGKLFFTDLANNLLYKADPAAYNQAIMDFGAIICKPALPECENCPLQEQCIAFKTGSVSALPVKENRVTRKKRYLTYFIFTVGTSVFLKRRSAKDIWEDLYEFYLLETSKQSKWSKMKVKKWLKTVGGIENFDILNISSIFKQQLTHQSLEGAFVEVNLPAIPSFLAKYTIVKQKDLASVPFPKFINQYLETRKLNDL